MKLMGYLWAICEIIDINSACLFLLRMRVSIKHKWSVQDIQFLLQINLLSQNNATKLLSKWSGRRPHHAFILPYHSAECCSRQSNSISLIWTYKDWDSINQNKYKKSEETIVTIKITRWSEQDTNLKPQDILRHSIRIDLNPSNRNWSHGISTVYSWNIHSLLLNKLCIRELYSNVL